MARETFAYWHIAGVIEAAVRARNYIALAKPLSHGRSVVAKPTSAPWI
jgi:hypothetical protein